MGAARGEERAREADQRVDVHLHPPQQHLVADVEPLRRRLARLVHEAVGRADAADAGIGERLHDPRQPVGRQQGPDVGESDELARDLGHRRLLGLLLAAALLEPNQPDPPGLVLPDDLRGAVGRGVVGDHQLEAVSGVVLREQVVELGPDRAHAVVDRNDHAQGGRDRRARHLEPAEAAHEGEQERVPDVAVERPPDGEPEHDDQRGHGGRVQGHAGSRTRSYVQRAARPPRSPLPRGSAPDSSGRIGTRAEVRQMPPARRFTAVRGDWKGSSPPALR